MKSVVAFVVAAVMLTPASAQAEDSSLLTRLGYSSSGDKGTFVVGVSDTVVVAANGIALRPGIACYGPACEPSRPARIEIQRDGGWVTWASGDLRTLEDSPKALDAKGTSTVRSVVPAFQDLPEMVSNTWTVTFLPRTRVEVTGKALIKPSASPTLDWEFRPKAKTITLRVTPAESGREVEVRNASVEGVPLMAKGRTNSRGEVTIAVKLKGAKRIQITVMPTSTRAGWQIVASAKAAQ